MQKRKEVYCPIILDAESPCLGGPICPDHNEGSPDFITPEQGKERGDICSLQEESS